MSDIVARLRRYGSLKVGERFPPDLGGDNAWGPPLTQLLNEAADRIELLESIAGPIEQEAYAKVRESIQRSAQERRGDG